MAKGDLHSPEWQTLPDGRVQITNHQSINHPSYFLQSSFLPNERLFFTSYRTGDAQLWEASLEDGTLKQLTDGPAIHPFSPAYIAARDSFVLTRGGSIWEFDRRSGAERLVVDLQTAQLGECSISADGEWLTAAYKDGPDQGIACGRTDGSEWRRIPFGRTVIHPQFHPLEPEWIEFAGDPAPRMHRVRRDGTAMECLYVHGNDEFVVHETFLGRTGDIVFTVWPFRLCRMDWTTRDIQTIAEHNAWHIAPNRAGTQVLFDTNHPDLGIQVVNVQTGAIRDVCPSEASNGGSQWKTSRYALAEDFAAARSAAQKHLSWMEAGTDTVYGPQWTHPHPSWSHDETRIAFASDRTGYPQVYIANL